MASPRMSARLELLGFVELLPSRRSVASSLQLGLKSSMICLLTARMTSLTVVSCSEVWLITEIIIGPPSQIGCAHPTAGPCGGSPKFLEFGSFCGGLHVQGRARIADQQLATAD